MKESVLLRTNAEHLLPVNRSLPYTLQWMDRAVNRFRPYTKMYSKREYRHNNHSVGSATVHLVWIPKRRKKVLVGDVKLRLSQILTEVAAEKGWIIKCLEIAPDHVHVLVEHDPNTPINSIVKAFKGRSSRYLRQEFPHLLKIPALWTHAYFYDTTGKVSSAIIEAYINAPHHSK